MPPPSFPHLVGKSNASFPVDTAQIVALFMERVFLVTFFHCLRILLSTDIRLKRPREINWMMLIAALLMFIFASLDVAFGLRHNIEAFIYFQGDPVQNFADISNWVNVMKMGNFVAQTFVGDAILLYRCWIVYSRNWPIVFLPVLMWMAETVCGAMIIFHEATLASSDKLLNSSSLVPWITSMLALTLVTNLTTTLFRIWIIRKNLRHRSVLTMTNPLTSVIRVLVESGVFYTITIVVLFVLYMSSNNGQLGVSNAVVQIIGITFNLIITRVDRGEATQPGWLLPKVTQSMGDNNMALHMINIQTTITRYPPDEESKSDEMTKSSHHSTSPHDRFSTAGPGHL
ncbi:hypothetical protein AMATHDRAFT_73422 [Amanita thiersii Skay4041]|uniref:Uncharacterized protein n=1 Tax=Amanita thiersii Skay4041 TaxID=703135 RepID=A0A2A9P010_9AGAR|nr:hypothetical protein AMATHDRAFT_73422 [Amanita thiersii Skay4041]